MLKALGYWFVSRGTWRSLSLPTLIEILSFIISSRYGRTSFSVSHTTHQVLPLSQEDFSLRDMIVRSGPVGTWHVEVGIERGGLSHLNDGFDESAISQDLYRC